MKINLKHVIYKLLTISVIVGVITFFAFVGLTIWKVERSIGVAAIVDFSDIYLVNMSNVQVYVSNNNSWTLSEVVNVSVSNRTTINYSSGTKIYLNCSRFTFEEDLIYQFYSTLPSYNVTITEFQDLTKTWNSNFVTVHYLTGVNSWKTYNPNKNQTGGIRSEGTIRYLKR